MYAVDSAGGLLKGRRVPGEVVVDDPAALTLEVQPLLRHRGRDNDVRPKRSIEGAATLCTFAFVLVAGEASHLTTGSLQGVDPGRPELGRLVLEHKVEESCRAGPNVLPSR